MNSKPKNQERQADNQANEARQNPHHKEHRPGRGSQHGSGDGAEQQDQEEFDRGGEPPAD
jgi:hypothetical protein